MLVARDADDPRFGPLREVVGDAALDDFLLAALRDVIAATVRIDGASISVLARSIDRALALRRVLPAGLDFLIPGDHDAAARRLPDVFTPHAEAGFERVLLIEGDVLALPSRVVGTGLGALAAADAVIGGGRPGDHAYALGLLAGARSSAAILTAAVDDGEDALALRELARAVGLTSRRLDPLPTLGQCADLPTIRTVTDGREPLGAHLARAMATVEVVDAGASAVLAESPRSARWW